MKYLKGFVVGLLFAFILAGIIGAVCGTNADYNECEEQEVDNR